MFDSVSFVTKVDCEDDVNKRRKIHVLFGIQTSKEESAWIGLRQDYRSNKYVWAWSDGSPADEASWKYGLT